MKMYMPPILSLHSLWLQSKSGHSRLPFPWNGYTVMTLTQADDFNGLAAKAFV